MDFLDKSFGKDMIPKFKAALMKVLDEARSAENSGDAGSAAVKYDAAHRLAMQLVSSAATEREELDLKKKAITYRKYAEALRRGEIAPAAAPAPPARKSSAPSRPSDVVEKDRKKQPKEKEDSAEMKRVVEGLMQTAKVTWADIGGLEDVKQEVKFALGIWLARPPLQPSGKPVQLQSWRNMLFYGPPGTGKTLLAAATSRALESDAARGAVFFNVKVSSVLSKYFGESTKIISELYGTARDLSPAVIFLDEFESLAANRDEGTDSGPERRILSTILAELDGLAEKGRTDIYVLTIAATNRPWDLDAAVLSRFDKKILIPLPDEVTRRCILDIMIDRKGLESKVTKEELVAMTGGFSGRELERFCKEAQTRMIQEMNTNIPAMVDAGFDKIKGHTVKVRPLTAEDFRAAATRINPVTTEKDVERYLKWKEDNS